MSRGNELVGPLVVAAGALMSGLLSDILSRNQMKALGSAVSLTFYSPAVLPEATTIEIAPEYPGVNWAVLKDELGANVVPTVDGAVTIPAPSFLDMRFMLGVGAGAGGREFKFMAKLDYADSMG